jgi:hypothetical protein
MSPTCPIPTMRMKNRLRAKPLPDFPQDDSASRYASADRVSEFSQQHSDKLIALGALFAAAASVVLGAQLFILAVS